MIPTYNDRELIEGLCSQVLSLGENYTVLILDDGSQPPIAAKPRPGVLLYRLPSNYGLGMCTSIAIDHLLAHGYDVLVRIDGDGQHPVDAIPSLVSRIVSGADVSIGARTNANTGRGIRSRAANWVRAYYRVTSRLVAGAGVPADLTSGFITMNRRAASVLSLKALDRYPEPEIMLAAHQARLSVEDVPVMQNTRSVGRSTISLRRAFLLVYRYNLMILMLALDRMRSR